MADRLTVGVAARLSRYLQVLTQARKMGKMRISSQEIADYTNINATQIRRDLSAFGKFGKRGVGYNIDSLLGEIRKILRTQGQHNIALIGAGRLGQAIASSPIFAEHGINIAAVFDTDPEKLGRPIGHVTVSEYGGLRDSVHDKNIIVGVLAVPATGAQRAADDLVGVGREDHLQLLGGAARDAGRRDGAHVEPGRRAALRAVLPSDLEPVPGTALRAEPGTCCSCPVRILLWHGYLLGGTGSNVYTRALAREWSHAGHDVDDRLPGAAARSATTSAARASSCPSCRTACCRSSCSTATRGSRRGCCRTSRVEERDALRRGERRSACASCCRPTSSSRTTCCSAGPSPPRAARRYAVKAHGSELEYSMRGNGRSSSGWGAEALAGADAVFVGSAHIRAVLEDVVGHVDRVLRGPARRRRRGVRARGRARGARRADREAADDDPQERRRAPSRPWQRGALRASSSRATSRPSSTSAS